MPGGGRSSQRDQQAVAPFRLAHQAARVCYIQLYQKRVVQRAAINRKDSIVEGVVVGLAGVDLMVVRSPRLPNAASQTCIPTGGRPAFAWVHWVLRHNLTSRSAESSKLVFRLLQSSCQELKERVTDEDENRVVHDAAKMSLARPAKTVSESSLEVMFSFVPAAIVSEAACFAAQ